MAEIVVAFAIQKLGDFMAKTVGDYLTGILASPDELRSNVRWLREELEYMESFLQYANKKQETDSLVRHWIYDIRTLAEDTTCVLETFTRKIDSVLNKNGCIEIVRIYACTCRNGADINEINQQIGSLKERVVEISKRRETYGIRNLFDDGGKTSASGVTEWRRTTSFADTHKPIVGRDHAKQDLENKLLDNNPRRSIITIHGMGGLGKTTLARYLYNSPRIIKFFARRAWVCVSQEYNVADLLRSVIKSFRKGCSYDELMLIKNMEVEDLERHVHALLRVRKYLVVVDDVWTKEAWESLERAFPDGGYGSRVLLTTRDTNVATRMNGTSHVHNLRFLHRSESMELFREILSSRHDMGYRRLSSDMQDLGEKMVAKCGGLPLAVVVLSGLLVQKHHLEDWQQVKDHIWRHLANDSVEISNLLSLSYDCLPRELRECFLYLGTFPEDYLIDAEELMYLWMGEQFIPPGEDMEDVAESYLNELIDRGLIVVEEKLWEKIIKCRIHDLLRDLAIKMASSKKLFDIYNSVSNHSSLVRQSRHAVHSEIQRYLSFDYPYIRLQSLVIINLDREQVDAPQLFVIFKTYNTLCVLKLEKVDLPVQLPVFIGLLVQLKFLGLLDTRTEVLPPSIGNLKSLQTLEALPIDRAECELPPETSKLTNLRHLICRMRGNTYNVGALCNLRTLKNIKYDHWLAIDTKNLGSLRELVIEDIYNHTVKPGDGYSQPFTHLKKLRALVLICRHGEKFPRLDSFFVYRCQNLRKLWFEGMITELPDIEILPKSITVLKLALTNLEQDPVPKLGLLPNLRHLYLYESHKSETMVFDPLSFPQLEILDLRDLDKLKKMELADGAMPKVKCLHVNECYQLVDIPRILEQILIRGGGERGYFDPHVYFPSIYV